MSNQLSNYADVQTRTRPVRHGPARRSIRTSGRPPGLLRNEEVAGSNPVTPTAFHLVGALWLDQGTCVKINAALDQRRRERRPRRVSSLCCGPRRHAHRSSTQCLSRSPRRDDLFPKLRVTSSEAQTSVSLMYCPQPWGMIFRHTARGTRWDCRSGHTLRGSCWVERCGCS